MLSPSPFSWHLSIASKFFSARAEGQCTADGSQVARNASPCCQPSAPLALGSPESKTQALASWQPLASQVQYFALNNQSAPRTFSPTPQASVQPRFGSPRLPPPKAGSMLTMPSSRSRCSMASMIRCVSPLEPTTGASRPKSTPPCAPEAPEPPQPRRTCILFRLPLSGDPPPGDDFSGLRATIVMVLADTSPPTPLPPPLGSSSPHSSNPPPPHWSRPICSSSCRAPDLAQVGIPGWSGGGAEGPAHSSSRSSSKSPGATAPVSWPPSDSSLKSLKSPSSDPEPSSLPLASPPLRSRLARRLRACAVAAAAFPFDLASCLARERISLVSAIRARSALAFVAASALASAAFLALPVPRPALGPRAFRPLVGARAIFLSAASPPASRIAFSTRRRHLYAGVPLASPPTSPPAPSPLRPGLSSGVPGLSGEGGPPEALWGSPPALRSMWPRPSAATACVRGSAAEFSIALHRARTAPALTRARTCLLEAPDAALATAHTASFCTSACPSACPSAALAPPWASAAASPADSSRAAKAKSGSSNPASNTFWIWSEVPAVMLERVQQTSLRAAAAADRLRVGYLGLASSSLFRAGRNPGAVTTASVEASSPVTRLPTQRRAGALTFGVGWSRSATSERTKSPAALAPPSAPPSAF
mmetsp:Transcript_42257/g.95582  ORF Transcript_42257/g.95582 Transcript_42257/m.95582 type:complete len:650 (+) Transcript_42257:171-2120(+)